MTDIIIYNGITYDFYGYVLYLYCEGAYFYSVYRIDKSGKAMLDLSQRGFSETLTGQLDYVSESLDHVAPGTGKKTQRLNSSFIESILIFKRIDP